MKLSTLIAIPVIGGALLTGCGGSIIQDMIDEFTATEIKADTPEEAIKKLKMNKYNLIVNDMNETKCDGILIKAVAVKYGFDEPSFLNNSKNAHLTCGDLGKENNRNEDSQCAEVSINDIEGQDDITGAFKGDSQCILATNQKSTDDDWEKLVDDQKKESE
jgi:hypothetical protein